MAVDLCVVYMRATYSKYILHKSSKPATYIWVRLIIGCVQYTLKYGRRVTSVCIKLRSYLTLEDNHLEVVIVKGSSSISIKSAPDVICNCRRHTSIFVVVASVREQATLTI